MNLAETFRKYRILSVAAIVCVTLLVVAGLWSAINAFSPLPPRTVTMAAGVEGGAYYQHAQRYREILARSGIDLKILATAGSLDNLKRLNDPGSGVDVAFLQGGTPGTGTAAHLASLGTVFYEPLWFFCRAGTRNKGVEALRGGRISIGPEGSGTRALVLELLKRNGMAEGFAELLPLTFAEAAEQLLAGKIDAALVLASWESPVVQRLLAAEQIDLLGFPRADAYAALYPYLNKLTLPAGIGDLVRNRPPGETPLLAPKASLVVRGDLHPAIQYLLLDAAEQVHSAPGLFRKTGQFPAGESLELPLSDEARRFYKSGQPFLQRYLPFWLAVMLGRLLFMLIPLLGILLPLMKIIPALFGWQMRRRIYKLYYELRMIEHAWENRDAAEVSNDLEVQLDNLEERAAKLWLPVSSMGALYQFKEHLGLVRKRMAGQD